MDSICREDIKYNEKKYYIILYIYIYIYNNIYNYIIFIYIIIYIYNNNIYILVIPEGFKNPAVNVTPPVELGEGKTGCISIKIR